MEGYALRALAGRHYGYRDTEDIRTFRPTHGDVLDRMAYRGLVGSALAAWAHVTMIHAAKGFMLGIRFAEDGAARHVPGSAERAELAYPAGDPNTSVSREVTGTSQTLGCMRLHAIVTVVLTPFLVDPLRVRLVRRRLGLVGSVACCFSTIGGSGQIDSTQSAR